MAAAAANPADLFRSDTKPISQPAAPPISDFPSNTPYPGKYEFEIFFSKAQESESKKTISYIYSVEEAKLYVRMRVHCPVHFKTCGEPPAGSIVRAMVIYSRPQDVGDVVRRCMNHTMEDKDSITYPDHLVRCHNPRGVAYETTGPSQRHSVTFPWDPPPPGSAHITGIYEFMCFSSCSGTINRRPTQMIFTLECGGEILGRQVIELRICACPGRDIVLSESGGTLSAGGAASGERKRKGRAGGSGGGGGLPTMAAMGGALGGGGEEEAFASLTTNLTSVEPLGKRHRDNEVYTVQVRGRELYKIVMTIVRNYEISRRYEELAPLLKQMKELQAMSGGITNPLAALNNPAPAPAPATPNSLSADLGNNNHSNNNKNGRSSASALVSPNSTPPVEAMEEEMGDEMGTGARALPLPAFASQNLRSLLPEQLTPDMPIYDWLVAQELEGHGEAFARLGFHTLEDLENILSMELLEKMGMALEDRERLYGAFIQYKSMRQASQLSGLSSFSGGLSSQNSLTDSDGARGGRSEGFRIAKTKITANYKFPKRRTAFPVE